MAKREKVDGIPTIGMPLVERVAIVRGAAGCGKTQRLIDGVCDLLDAGTKASDVLVVCATPDAACAFEERLAAHGSKADPVRVVCSRDLAIELLAEPGAVALFGHGPRVLLPFEQDILFEDVKTSGVEVDRIEGMLAFFKRSMTEISDDHPDFLMDDDERAVMGALRRGLELRGAFLEQQLSANAARYLAQSERPARYRHVFVDDWQRLSRASQVMSALLAGQSLYVAHDPSTCEQALETYPYAGGTDELMRANPHATVEELTQYRGPRAIGAAIDALRREAGLNEALGQCPEIADTPGSLDVEVLDTADDDVNRTAEIVDEAIGHGILPRDIFVVSPNASWSARMGFALEKRGIASARSHDWTERIETVANDAQGTACLKVITCTLLAADPTDDAAWRSWCAFDEPLAASSEVAIAAQIAFDKGLAFHEVLASGELAASARTARLDAVYRRVSALLERVRGLGNDELVQVLTREFFGQDAPVPAALLDLFADMPVEGDVSAIRESILGKATHPLGWQPFDGEGSRFGDQHSAFCLRTETSNAVRVGPMGRLCGLSARLVVFTGFVNGLFPSHDFFDRTATPPGDVERARAAHARTLGCALAKSRESAAFTAFTKIPCSEARSLGVKIYRIGLEKGLQTARVSPSIFLAYLQGHAQ